MANSFPSKLSISLNLYSLLFLLLYLKTLLSDHPGPTPPSRLLLPTEPPPDPEPEHCTRVQEFPAPDSKCAYVKSHDSCRHKGYINYLEIFYCQFRNYPSLGHTALLVWLVVLFYLLGNTAAEFFCPSLENLSRIMKLSPTIAGVTLLSLGNGATDVFSSIISFTRTGNGSVGLNSVLGGAFFISSVVVGVIGISIGSQKITIDRPSFVRDVLFFIFTLSALLVVVSVKTIGLLGSMCFVSIYFVYVFTVSAMHLLKNTPNPDPISAADNMGIPLLGCVGEEEIKSVAILMDRSDTDSWKNDFGKLSDDSSRWSTYLVKLVRVLELPLQLPRRLTIPIVAEDRWSKPYAVISITLAPVLLAALCNSQRDNVGFKGSTVTYLTSGLIGLILGNLAFATTKKWSPPKTGLSLWLSAGFLMSVTWTYIIAEELVSLLISVGVVLGISPSVLGLTVLAWGNSLGDLIANTAMAVNVRPGGAQIAISGCYAGPMFNTLMGLGLSLVFQSWSKYPSPYEIPGDGSVYETIGFSICGLLWALIIVPRRNMRLDRFLGFGLLAIYSCFLCLRIARTAGLLTGQD